VIFPNWEKQGLNCVVPNGLDHKAPFALISSGCRLLIGLAGRAKIDYPTKALALALVEVEKLQWKCYRVLFCLLDRLELVRFPTNKIILDKANQTLDPISHYIKQSCVKETHEPISWVFHPAEIKISFIQIE